MGAVDSEAGTLSCNDSTLAPGASTNCTGSFTPTASGSNTVTASGSTQLGTITATSVSQPFVVENPSIDVEKTCAVTGEDEITWTVDWENTGDITLTSVSIDDTRTGNLFSGTLGLGETGQDTFVESPLAPGTHSNTATASGSTQLGTITATATQPFVLENPSISVTKVCAVTGEDEITWTKIGKILVM